MLNTRYKGFLGIFLLLVWGELAFAGDALHDKNGFKPITNIVPLIQADKSNADNSVKDYKLSQSLYNIPSLKMIDKEGNDIDLLEMLDYGGPVMVQFIFATCSTICPILSACFASVQPDLEALSDGTYRLVSISIDPEQDTPERLTEYAKRFKAGKNWYFLTGNRHDVAKILKAFDATYKGNNKMYHQSLTFMRPYKKANWTRIEGMLGKNDFLMEYKKMMGLSGRAKE